MVSEFTLMGIGLQLFARLTREMKEYLVDDFGRAYSPSMAAQYTPPRPELGQPHPTEPESKLPASIRRPAPPPIPIPHLSLPPRSIEGAHAGPFPVRQPYTWQPTSAVPNGQTVPQLGIYLPGSRQTARAAAVPDDGFASVCQIAF